MTETQTLPRILIVEDEEPLRLLYQEILSSEALTGRPYEVTSVESVEMGAGLLLSRPYDVLLTDYRLPGRNGIQLIEDVRAARLDTQCLLISGLVDANLVRMAYEAGALT
ncbi:MAG TPA: response regulator, partial [Candidatus Sumerlaeota bacterium]|nr:response regulator [Candidatus Sumerlaeota bacterium]